MTFDADFKYFGQHIQTFKFFQEKCDLPFKSCYFTIEKSLLKIFCTSNFCLFTNFQNFCCTFYDKLGTKYC